MIPGLVPVVSHDQKVTNNVAHHFDHLNLGNSMTPLMVDPHHMMLIPMHWHYMTPKPIPVTACDVNPDVSSITWQRKVLLHLLSIVLTWGMQWHHFLYHWHLVIPTTMPMLHLILIILIKQMQWYHWCGHWHHMMLMLMPMVWHDQTSHD